MFRSDSKFVDPSFYVDPLASEFSGVECSITWGQFWGAITGQGDPAERRRAEEAQREAERAAAEARAAYEREQRAAEQAVADQRAAMEAQQAEQARVKAEQEALLQQVQTESLISKKTGAAAVAQQRVRSGLELAQAQQQLAQQSVRAPKVAGATVGQPGIATTKIKSRISIGGYGGTEPGRINPTGLNI